MERETKEVNKFGYSQELLDLHKQIDYREVAKGAWAMMNHEQTEEVGCKNCKNFVACGLSAIKDGKHIYSYSCKLKMCEYEEDKKYNAANRILARMWNWRSKKTLNIDKIAMEDIVREELR